MTVVATAVVAAAAVAAAAAAVAAAVVAATAGISSLGSATSGGSSGASIWRRCKEGAVLLVGNMADGGMDGRTCRQTDKLIG